MPLAPQLLFPLSQHREQWSMAVHTTRNHPGMSSTINSAVNEIQYCGICKTCSATYSLFVIFFSSHIISWCNTQQKKKEKQKTERKEKKRIHTNKQKNPTKPIINKHARPSPPLPPLPPSKQNKSTNRNRKVHETFAMFPKYSSISIR